MKADPSLGVHLTAQRGTYKELLMKQVLWNVQTFKTRPFIAKIPPVAWGPTYGLARARTNQPRRAERVTGYSTRWTVTVFAPVSFAGRGRVAMSMGRNAPTYYRILVAVAMVFAVRCWPVTSTAKWDACVIRPMAMLHSPLDRISIYEHEPSTKATEGGREGGKGEQQKL